MGYSPAALGGASATEKWSMNETEIGYNLEKTKDTWSYRG